MWLQTKPIENKPESITETKEETIPLWEGFMNKIKNFIQETIDDPVTNLLIPLGEILLIILITFLVIRLVDQLVDRIFKLSKTDSNKALTLRKLIKSVSRYLIYFIAFVSLMIQIGFDPRPVLAGAGIVGLAIGFGAQSLVKDVITGFFLIFESQLEVGDIVQINGEINGTVEEVGLRVTKIREFNQRLHYLANGTITQVTNYNREKMRAIIPITVPYESNLDLVNRTLEELCEKIKEKYENDLVEEPEVMGVTKIDQTGVQFTITAICNPESYWKLEREMRKEAVLALNRNNIQIAYPRSVIYHSAEIEALSKNRPSKDNLLNAT